MKQLLVLIGMFCFCCVADAQDLKNKWGFGTQLTDRMLGISVKYACAPASALQAIVAPFNTKTADGLGTLRYYGLRYTYKIPADEDYALRIEPFVMGSVGWLNYQPVATDNLLLRMSSSATNTTTAQNLPAFSAGAGLEWWLGKRVSLSAELDYGRMRFENSVAGYTFFGAAGLHVFLK